MVIIAAPAPAQMAIATLWRLKINVASLRRCHKQVITQNLLSIGHNVVGGANGDGEQISRASRSKSEPVIISRVRRSSGLNFMWRNWNIVRLSEKKTGHLRRKLIKATFVCRHFCILLSWDKFCAWFNRIESDQCKSMIYFRIHNLRIEITFSIQNPIT